MVKERRLQYQDVAYDSKCFPHRKWRYGILKEGGRILKPSRGVTPLPKGWSWKKCSRRIK